MKIIRMNLSTKLFIIVSNKVVNVIADQRKYQT